MRILHVEAQHLFMCNKGTEIFDVYIKDEADEEIEQLKKGKDRYCKALIEIAGFEGVDFDGSQIAIEALKERV